VTTRRGEEYDDAEEQEGEAQGWRQQKRRMTATTPSRVPIYSSGEEEEEVPRRWQGKGIDSSLQKHEPSTANLSAATYRAFRRKLDIYYRMCRGRGEICMREAAYSVFASLSATHYELSESMSLDRIDAEGLKYIGEVLDRQFKATEDIEIPRICGEFLYIFVRGRGETMSQYLSRHAAQRQKLSEAGITLPSILSGLHLLRRAAIPKWTETQARSLCGGKMTVEAIEPALLRVFGADHVADARDITRAGKAGPSSAKEDSHFVQSEVYLADGDEEEYWEEEDVDQYENDWWQEDGHDDYYEDEEAYYGSQDCEFDDEAEYDEE
jgi:hypothetical protein